MEVLMLFGMRAMTHSTQPKYKLNLVPLSGLLRLFHRRFASSGLARTS
jgi:hypothetical protein